MNPVDRIGEALLTFTTIMVPVLIFIGIASHVYLRKLRGPSKLERALRERLKGLQQRDV